MRKELFDELVESVEEGMAIMRGERKPSRVFTVETKPDVKSIRSKFGISRRQFASMLGISLRTLENWEQGHRTPKGPARVLLHVAETHPEIVWQVVKGRREAQNLSDVTK